MGMNLQSLVLGIVFLAAVLGFEAIFIYLRDVRGPQARVSKRMQLLAAGATNAEIMASLRRAQSNVRADFLPAIVGYLEGKMTQAGMRMSANRMLVIMIVTTIGIGVVFPIIGGITGSIHSAAGFIMIVIFAGALGILVPLMVINRQADKRIKKFEEQFPVALDILVRGLRAGYPVSSALELLVTEVPDPISSEFGLVVAEMNYGYNLRDAMSNLAGRIGTQDIQMFVVSIAIQAETGGSLADILDGLSRVIRDRHSMVLKVRALASEGKMTGMLLSALPVLTFVAMFAFEPHFYLDVSDDPLFLPAYLGVGVLYTTGVMIMRKLIAIKV